MHALQEKETLLSRVRRIAGRVKAVEKALTSGAEGSDALFEAMQSYLT